MNQISQRYTTLTSNLVYEDKTIMESALLGDKNSTKETKNILSTLFTNVVSILVQEGAIK